MTWMIHESHISTEEQMFCLLNIYSRKWMLTSIHNTELVGLKTSNSIKARFLRFIWVVTAVAHKAQLHIKSCLIFILCIHWGNLIYTKKCDLHKESPRLNSWYWGSNLNDFRYQGWEMILPETMKSQCLLDMTNQNRIKQMFILCSYLKRNVHFHPCVIMIRIYSFANTQ